MLIVHGHPPRLPSSYGKPSPYHACHPGPARLELKVEGQKQAAATANIDIGRGRYTVIAVPEGKGVGLRVYKDGTAVPGKARMRTINAAAELDKADMRVDGKEVARIRPAEATSYASVPPGRHDLSVTRMGGGGGAAGLGEGRAAGGGDRLQRHRGREPWHAHAGPLGLRSDGRLERRAGHGLRRRGR